MAKATLYPTKIEQPKKNVTDEILIDIFNQYKEENKTTIGISTIILVVSEIYKLIYRKKCSKNNLSSDSVAV